MSKKSTNDRWNPSVYKETSLNSYIEFYGWDSIEHMVIQDGLTQHQAEVIEDLFIVNATKDGFCINKQRSGGRWRDNQNECQHEYQREYYKKRKQTEKYKEYQREYQRQYRLKKKQQTIKEQ